MGVSRKAIQCLHYSARKEFHMEVRKERKNGGEKPDGNDI